MSLEADLSLVGPLDEEAAGWHLDFSYETWAEDPANMCWTLNSWKLGDNKLILFEAPTFVVTCYAIETKEGWYVQSSMVGISPVSLIYLDSYNPELESCEEEEGLAQVMWDGGSGQASSFMGDTWSTFRK